MTQSGEETLLEFPCQFPIKMMGRDSDRFRRIAIELVEQHTGRISADAITTAASRRGTFLSITVTINAESQEQLDDIYRSLSAHDEILVAL